jgi:L-glyceraldehyde 3-phosphate reductase
MSHSIWHDHSVAAPLTTAFAISTSQITTVHHQAQSLAQMAIAWALRDPRMTSALIGASRPEQIDECVKALANVLFDESELAEIDQHAKDLNINLWSQSSMS